MKIVISTESTSDLSKELLEKYNIKSTPFGILLGEELHYDGEIDALDIFKYVEENKILPKTTAINEYQYRDFFRELREEYDAVIHISFGSHFSTACSQAMKASRKFENVYVIDAMSLSSGVGLQCIYAAELVEKGLKPEEIVKKVSDRVKSVQASFVVHTLEYLHKGGRCSGLNRVLGTVLRIKPQILVVDGYMKPGKKYMGRKKSVIEKYCNDILKEFPNIDKSHVFITHSHASEDMVEVAREILKKAGVKNIHETFAGCTVSSHCGPMTLGILYYADGGDQD